MKRALIAFGAIVLIGVLALGAIVVQTFRGRAPISDGRDIRSIHIVADGTTSLAIVKIGDGKVALVDAGQDSTGKALLAALAQQHIARDAVAAILLTHAHRDHVGAVPLFPRAQVMALDAEPVKDLTVARRLRGGETFMLGDKRVRVFAVPGHTAGSAAYLIDDVLFIGDSADVKADRTMVGAPWIFSDNQAQNRESLRRLARELGQESTPVRAIVPSHSGAVDGLAPLLVFAGS